MRPLAPVAAALALWAWPLIVQAGPAAGDPPTQIDARTQEKAKKHAKAGSAAFRDGDYATAIVEFEAASKLLPTPKLDYNIAVSHHRLMLAAEEEETRNNHADQAIEAYNRYLEGKPDAPDRLEVAQTVRELGGTPATFRGLKSAFEGHDEVVEREDELALPGDEGEGEGEHAGGGKGESESESEHTDQGEGEPGDQPTPEPVPPPEPPPQPTERYHARVYFGPHIGVVPQQFSNEEVAGAAMLMAEGQGGGYVGRRHRALLGAELAFYVQNGTKDVLTFSGGHVAFSADYEFPVGTKHRTVLGFGGMGGWSHQAMRTAEKAAPPLCTEGAEQGRRVAGRHGGVVGARFRVGILFGARRWHEVDFALHPNLGVYGPGSKGQDCAGDESDRPFRNFGVAPVMASIWAGFGYAFRF